MNESVIVNALQENIEHPISWKYRNYMLHVAKEKETKESLLKTQRSYLVSIGDLSQNEFLENVSRPEYRGSFILRDREEEEKLEEKAQNRETQIIKRKEKDVDYSVTASAQMRQLHFWNALQSYERDIRIRCSPSPNDKYYTQRAFLCIVLEEWRKGFSLAKKCGAPDAAVVCAFSVCNFQEVVRIFNNNSLLLDVSHISAISKIELYLMLALSFLATYNFVTDDDIHTFFENNLSSPLLTPVQNAIKSIRERNFANVFSSIKEMEPIINFSMFISPVWEKLLENIKCNIVAHYVRPLSTVNLSKIAEDTKFSQSEIGILLCEAIDNGMAKGRVDFVDKVFIEAPLERTFEDRDALKKADDAVILANESSWKKKIFGDISKNA